MRVSLVLGIVLGISARPIRIEAETAATLCMELSYSDRVLLDQDSRDECSYLLSQSDLLPFIRQHRSAEEAAEDIANQLRSRFKLRNRNRAKGRRNLMDQVCETLESSSTVNVLSDNEPVGISYDGNGLLAGINVDANPSILSGIFQTSTLQPRPTSTFRSHRETFQERTSPLGSAPSPTASSRFDGLEINGQGILDGVDLAIGGSCEGS